MRIRAPRGCLFAMLAFAAASSGTPAFAQDPSATTPAPAVAAVPTDLVRLKDGSLYRGTIMELVVGDHVDLRLTSGEVKRFAMSDVKYAGATAGEASAQTPALVSPPAVSDHTPQPPAIRPLVAVRAEEANVHLVGDSPDIDFHIRTGEATMGGWGLGAQV